MEGIVGSAVKSHKQGLEWLATMLSIARPEAVFGVPHQVGDTTVITASEGFAATGYGFGVGGEGDPDSGGKSDGHAGPGTGGGGGGGGVSFGRAVAVIEVSPSGVRVTPVVDATKLGLAFITMVGGVALMRRRMRRG